MFAENVAFGSNRYETLCIELYESLTRPRTHLTDAMGDLKGESPAPGGVRGFQDGHFGGGRRVGRQADVWSAHGKKIRATTGDFK